MCAGMNEPEKKASEGCFLRFHSISLLFFVFHRLRADSPALLRRLDNPSLCFKEKITRLTGQYGSTVLCVKNELKITADALELTKAICYAGAEEADNGSAIAGAAIKLFAPKNIPREQLPRQLQMHSAGDNDFRDKFWGA
jgi:hypothetical protein